MSPSMALGYLSLVGYLAVIAIAIRRAWPMSNDGWSLENHDFDKMPKVIEWALKNCLDQGLMVISDRDSNKFIQFRKGIFRKGEYGLMFEFPNADWSTEFVPKLRDALITENICFREVRERGKGIATLIRVDCGRDVDKCVYLTRLCFLEILGLASNIRFESKPSRYSKWSGLVDDPDLVPPSSLSETRARTSWSETRARNREMGRPDQNLILMAMLLMVGLIVFYPIFWLSWFRSGDAVSDWLLAIGSAQFEGSHSTWIMLLIFVALVTGTLWAKRMIGRDLKWRKRTMVDRATSVATIYGLPLAVIFSWLGL